MYFLTFGTDCSRVVGFLNIYIQMYISQGHNLQKLKNVSLETVNSFGSKI